MSIATIRQIFEQHFGAPPTSVSPLQGNLGASGRQILRVSGDGHKAIGIVYDMREENAAFLEFSRHFRRHGLPVPEIYGEDLEHNAYLEEDLGDTTLFEFLAQHRDGENIAPEAIEAYRKAIAVLPRFQVEGGQNPRLQRRLSSRQLRSPIDCVGPELFQVLFPATRRHRLQRAGTGRRLSGV